RSFAGEDPEAMDAILIAFIDSTRANLKALEAAFQKGEKEKVSAVAHKMLPMFRQLKVPHLIEKLAILENADGKEKRKVKIQVFITEVDELLQQLEKEITG